MNILTSKLIKAHLPCPSCDSSDAYSEYDDGHGYCFSCLQYFKSKEELISEDTFTYEYIPIRGLSKEALSFYDIKTKINIEGKPVSLGFRYPNGNYKIRLLDRKEFYSKGSTTKAGLFGQDRFSEGSNKYVVITEGEFDAVSIWQVLKLPAVSVSSSATAYADCVYSRSWLSSFERIYICFDTDRPGQQATERVAKLFDFHKVYILKLSRKDANEYLQHGEAEELRNIWWNAKQYKPESIISSLNEFEDALRKPPTPSIPYPFQKLNEMTYGIRTGESVLITAQEGIGKTEIMHAIEYSILTGSKENVGAIFLEETAKRHLQALAGLHLRTPVHLPAYDGSIDQTVRAVEEIVGGDNRLFMYTHYGNESSELLLDTIRFLVTACGCRYILLDHITMAVTGSATEDERRELDYLSTRLEMMVVELDFSLIIVSHVNDDGRTRGSRNISKICNTRIDCYRELLDNDDIIKRTVTFVVSKNRFGGKTGSAGAAIFDIDTYSWKEADNDNCIRITEDRNRIF